MVNMSFPQKTNSLITTLVIRDFLLFTYQTYFTSSNLNDIVYQVFRPIGQIAGYDTLQSLMYANFMSISKLKNQLEYIKAYAMFVVPHILSKMGNGMGFKCTNVRLADISSATKNCLKTSNCGNNTKKTNRPTKNWQNSWALASQQ